MRLLLFCVILFIGATACHKPKEKPRSKTDYIPINAANTTQSVAIGQPIHSRVNCGFYERFADITFLNFEVKERLPKQYEIRARAFYDNIIYGNSSLVVSTFDTTLTLPTTTAGQYILKFYTSNMLVEADTVQVN